MTKFTELGISESTVSRLESHGITEPTEVQVKSIPPIYEGKDVLVESETGSGKTLGFSLPLIEKISGDKPKALILSPTRELAKQISKEINKFSSEQTDLATIYGGVSYDPQRKDLQTANIVVGTPGRVLDLLKQGDIDLSELEYFVLDEADRMLDMGFQDELEQIIQKCPEERQNLLFGATIPGELKTMCNRYDIEPVTIRIKASKHTQNLKERYIDVKKHEKLSALVTLLRERDRDLSVVFCRTKNTTRWLTKALKKNDIKAETLNGDMSQHQREETVKDFKKGKFRVIVATDVAARGLHIENVSHVFNYDLPDKVDTYTHRVGRAGRQGAEGEAITLLAKKDHQKFRSIKRKKDGIKRFGRDMDFVNAKTP